MSLERNSQTSSPVRLVQIALLAAIQVVMSFTPLGFIMVPFLAIKATLVHIPVILGGVLLGPGVGAVLGGIFGLCSIINNTLYPGPTSFVFSPFVAAGLYGLSGVLRTLMIVMIPRILVGVMAGLVAGPRYQGSRLRLLVAGGASSMTNTILVLGGIYLLYGRDYAQTIGQSYQLLLAYILGVVSFNGVIEALLAALLTAAMVPILRRVAHRTGNR